MNRVSHSDPSDLPPAEPISVDVKELLFSVARAWYWILLGALLAFLAARTYLRYSVPVYRASGTILLEDKEGRGGENLTEEAVLDEFGLLDPGYDIRNEIQILRSRTLMSEVMDRLGLDVRYIGLGRLKQTEYYADAAPVLVDSIGWYAEQGSRRITIEPVDATTFIHHGTNGETTRHRFGEPLLAGRDTFWLRRNFAAPTGKEHVVIVTGVGPLRYIGRLSVKKSGEAPSILAISMEDEVPRRAVDIIDTLIEVYNQAAIEDKRQVAEKTLAFIDGRLLLLSSELKSVEGGLENYKADNALQGEEFTRVSMLLREISEYDNELSNRQVRLDLLRAVRDSMVRGDDPYAFELIPANVIMRGSGSLDDQIRNFNQTLQTRDRLRRSAAENNPQLRTLNDELLEMHAGIAQSIDILIRGTELEVRETRAKIDALQRKISQVPRQERELLEIKRQQNIKQGLYLFLLEKKEEAALAAAIVVPNARVIDPAMVRPGPISPEPKKIYTLFLLAGLALPIAWAVIRKLLDGRVYRVADVRGATRVPLLGVIGRAPTGTTVIPPGAGTEVGEMFRLLRSDLVYRLRDAARPCVLITSGNEREGKTFVAANLARGLALTRASVVVVDMNLRYPRLAEQLSVPAAPEPGLGDYLRGTARLEEIIRPVTEDGRLSLIPAGPPVDYPTELLSGARVGELIAALRERFEFVLLDTSAVGLVADAYGPAPYADLTILVARYAQTERTTLARLDEIAATGKINHPYVVLNDVAHQRYGYRQNERRRWWKFWAR